MTEQEKNNFIKKLYEKNHTDDWDSLPDDTKTTFYNKNIWRIKKYELTDEKVEQLVKEIYDLFVKNELWMDTSIYYNKHKIMTSNVPGTHYDNKSFLIKENQNFNGVIEEFDETHILSIISEGITNQTLMGYTGKKTFRTALKKIFSKYGLTYFVFNTQLNALRDF